MTKNDNKKIIYCCSCMTLYRVELISKPQRFTCKICGVENTLPAKK